MTSTRSKVAEPTAADNGADQAPRRGRPRSEKARAAVLAAAGELLLTQGLDATSVDAIAERAGVSKATIYRWWRTKETLALDALHDEWELGTPAVRDTGSLHGDLLALLRPWVRLVSRRPYARVVSALIAEARTDPGFAEEYLARLVRPRRDRARVVLERARERGELAAGVDIEIALDVIYGPLWHRLLQGHAPLNDRFVKQLVETALRGLLA
jgi:AcrR family transcriptional regulator